MHILRRSTSNIEMEYTRERFCFNGLGDEQSAMASSVPGMRARSGTMFATRNISCKLRAGSQIAVSWSTWLVIAYQRVVRYVKHPGVAESLLTFYIDNSTISGNRQCHYAAIP
ncbi:hypothetical protein FIBSPDRAFT_106534 [Athelia psychrophila]|uniref:Uncharacterized protein n=1 Tax=Athelia psychrophila TaxID=1759441 RepID=A0A166D8X8_9AGAM|nr:hypothetical protein FIBSPDRAFT_106534 [Fibularhizoctonia sp. CBS 109695]